MKQSVLYTILALVVIATLANTYYVTRIDDRLNRLEDIQPIPIVTAINLPTILPTAVPTITSIPFNIPETYTKLPIYSLCNDQRRELVYQLDDGTNIYKDAKGNLIRGKLVTCTN